MYIEIGGDYPNLIDGACVLLPILRIFFITMEGMTMSDEHLADDAAFVKCFWHNDFSFLEKARVNKASAPWYRKHAEAYI